VVFDLFGDWLLHGATVSVTSIRRPAGYRR
jgi:hypothetical protein